MNRQRIVILGGGNMGEVIVRSLLAAKFTQPKFITVVDRSVDRLKQLSRIYGVRVDSESADAVRTAMIIILAVKPQDALLACEPLRHTLPHSCLVISIMAGVPLRSIIQWLKHQRVIRSMPNTPAKIQCGMTVWVSTRAVTQSQLQTARQLFGAFGEQLQVRSEQLVDAATAVSGSGPAYVFAFAEQFIAAAQDVGFSQHDATTLVRQTFFGASQLMKHSTDEPSVLRKQVTSKKGTTAAALDVFDHSRVGVVIRKMVRAAYRRAQQLSHTFGKEEG